MNQYSHDAFQVSGYVVHIPNQAESQEIIQNAWAKFMKGGLNKEIENIANPSVHAIYYNYQDLGDNKDWSYEMLLGYITTTGTKQSDSQFQDITIPAQNYMYATISGNFQEILPIEWGKINAIPKSELDRSYGFDLEMYSEDYKTATLAVSVN